MWNTYTLGYTSCETETKRLIEINFLDFYPIQRNRNIMLMHNCQHVRFVQPKTRLTLQFKLNIEGFYCVQITRCAKVLKEHFFIILCYSSSFECFWLGVMEFCATKTFRSAVREGESWGVEGWGEGVSTGHVTVMGLKQLQSVGVEEGEERKAPRASYRNQK